MKLMTLITIRLRWRCNIDPLADSMSICSCLKKFTLLLLLIITRSGDAQAQPTPPSLRCISVEPSGAVTLTWITPADTGSIFGGYHVYYSSTFSGPFSAIDSIFNYNILTTTITTVNANNATLWFFIKTREGCCNNYSMASDTLRSMRMIVTPLSNEHVQLNWNRIHLPPLPSTLTGFIVEKEVSTGNFVSFRNTTDTTTTDTNFFCNRFINYRVIQADASGCQSVSSIDGELFRDTKGPAQTVLDTVSVDPLTGEVIITWKPDSSADTQGYVIYEFNGISYDSIGSVNGINTLIFTNTINDASTTVETYTVAAFDSCKNLGPLASDHNTIFLEHDLKLCEAQLDLKWTEYVNMAGGIARYEIWLSESGVWTQEAITLNNVFNYTKNLTLPGAVYEIVIRAVGTSGKTATSNKITVLADILQQPSFLYIRSASVNGSAVDVSLHVDPASDVREYRLYSSTWPSGPFTLAGSIGYSGSSTLSFTDISTAANSRPVFYKVAALDSCYLEKVESNIAATVHLSAEETDGVNGLLRWTSYAGWQNTPGSYHLFSTVNGIIQPSALAVVGGDTLEYNIDLSGAVDPGDDFCYVVMASEDLVNSYGFTDSAYSNIACIPLTPSCYIPNAFTPEGLNPVFRPILQFEEPATYSLQVFNRWGQEVYFSEDAAAGWNGNYNGNKAPAGIYAYRLIFKGKNLKEYRKTGTITLLR